jgi:hypothetical protein
LSDQQPTISSEPSRSFLGFAYRAYTSPIASALITAILLSSSFFIGAISSLGFEFLPLLHKQDLMAEIVFGVVAPATVILAVVRYSILAGLEAWKVDPKSSRWVGFLLLCVMPTASLVFLTAISFASDFLLGLVALIFEIWLLAFSLYQWRTRGARAFAYISLGTALILAFTLGVLYIDTLRLQSRSLVLESDQGTTREITIVISGSTGLLVFADRAVLPEFFPWERVRRVGATEARLQEEQDRQAFGKSYLDPLARRICLLQNRARDLFPRSIFRPRTCEH